MDRHWAPPLTRASRPVEHRCRPARGYRRLLLCLRFAAMHSGREWFWADYAASVREVLAAGPDVLDVGTPVPYRKELARIAPNGPAPRIWTLDVPEVGSNEVSVFGDAATWPFRSECFDGAI